MIRPSAARAPWPRPGWAPGRRPDVAGFTLIEVLIVVAIIGILSAIAYPSYGQYVRETRRSDAHLAVLGAVQSLERCRSTRYSYADCTLPNAESPERYYALTLASTATTYTITATAQNAQAADADCPTITMDHVGVRGPVETDGSSDCWN